MRRNPAGRQAGGPAGPAKGLYNTRMRGAAEGAGQAGPPGSRNYTALMRPPASPARRPTAARAKGRQPQPMQPSKTQYF